CDDTVAAVHPGVTDPWYDGIDEDCAGNDDFDQDGDGFHPDDPPYGPTQYVVDSGSLPGGDCDDTEPATFPGAPDAFYDGIDSDCAGGDDFDQDGDGHDDPSGGGD